MPDSRSLFVPRAVAVVGAACVLTAGLAGCATHSAAAVDPVAKAAAGSSTPADAPPSTSPASGSSVSVPSAGSSAPTIPASATPTTAPAACASATGSLPGSSITVCPAAAPVGAVVHITIKNCTVVDPGAGLPVMAAADLMFLGDSWLGTGGGGNNVPFSPRTGSTQATANFTIPATYTGGTEKAGPYPTLRTTPGRYEFATDPAGQCAVRFEVTAS